MYYTVFAKARCRAPSITTQACYRPSLDSRSKNVNFRCKCDFRNECFDAERAGCKGNGLPECLRPEGMPQSKTHKRNARHARGLSIDAAGNCSLGVE